MSRLALAPALALAALLPVGCASDSRDRAPHRPAPADPAYEAINRGLHDLGVQVAARAAAGWSDHLPLSASEPRRPLIAIGTITNRQTTLDTADLVRRIARELTVGGHVVVDDASQAGLLLTGELEAKHTAWQDEAALTLTIIEVAGGAPVVEATGAVIVKDGTPPSAADGSGGGRGPGSRVDD